MNRYKNPYPISKDRFSDPFAERAEKGRRRPKTAQAYIVSDCRCYQLEANIAYNWLGHSSVFLRLGGRNFLFDPVFAPSLDPFLGLLFRRYPGPIPKAADFPELDAVLISHNHQDHLDKDTLLSLDQKTACFIVPRGVRSYLIRFGIAAEKILELDWQNIARVGAVTVTCTPACHNSGRGPFDLNTTGWCSYVLSFGDDNVFFSGDTAFSPHFDDISRQFGSFRLAFMECGQYGVNWHYLHMFPEESAQAARILNAELTIPIHWGAYTLAGHPWDEPPRRFRLRAEELGIACQIPELYRMQTLCDHGKGAVFHECSAG